MNLCTALPCSSVQIEGFGSTFFYDDDTLGVAVATCDPFVMRADNFQG